MKVFQQMARKFYSCCFLDQSKIELNTSDYLLTVPVTHWCWFQKLEHYCVTRWRLHDIGVLWVESIIPISSHPSVGTFSLLELTNWCHYCWTDLRGLTRNLLSRLGWPWTHWCLPPFAFLSASQLKEKVYTTIPDLDFF